MAISDHQTRVAKMRATIVTVDPSQRLVEAMTAEAGRPRRLAMFDVPSGFVWPKEGEAWSIYEENGYWRLGNRFLTPEEDAVLTAMPPGAGITNDDARTLNGGKQLNVYGAPSNNFIPSWNATTGRWEVAPRSTPLVSALPGSPVDGQEIYYQNTTMATDGVMWHLRYRAASASALKWEVVGGSPIVKQIDGSILSGVVNTAYATYAPCAITVPLAGDYDITVSGMAFSGFGTAQWISWMAYTVGATAANDEDALELQTGAGLANAAERTRRRNAIAAGAVVTWAYRQSTATGTDYYRPSLRVVPVRVG